jgi:hypothetical protein
MNDTVPPVPLEKVEVYGVVEPLKLRLYEPAVAEPAGMVQVIGVTVCMPMLPPPKLTLIEPPLVSVPTARFESVGDVPPIQLNR